MSSTFPLGRLIATLAIIFCLSLLLLAKFGAVSLASVAQNGTDKAGPALNQRRIVDDWPGRNPVAVGIDPKIMDPLGSIIGGPPDTPVIPAGSVNGNGMIRAGQDTVNRVAASITVTTQLDVLDAAGGNCAAITSANLPGPDGLVSLREAICATNNGSGGDTILFSGVLNGTPITLSRANSGGNNEDANSTGDLDVTKTLTITGNGPTNTIIQAGTSSSNGIDKVFALNPICTSQVNVTISQVTVRNGKNTQAFNAPDSSYTGGGIDFCAPAGSSFLTITDSNITDNTVANGYGGGLDISTPAGWTGTVTLTNDLFQNNHTTSTTVISVGAGVNDWGSAQSVNITGCQFIGNTTASQVGDGAGLYIKQINGGSVNIHSSLFSGNLAGGNGGGIGVSNIDDANGSTPFQTVTIDQGTVLKNNVSGDVSNGTSGGGGLYINGNVTGLTTVSKSTFIGNSEAATTGTKLGGGAILVDRGDLTMSFSRIAGNSNNSGSPGGSGLFKDGGDLGTVTASNNWWGCSGGPGAAPCDTAVHGAGGSGTLGFTPFLRIKSTPASNPILTNQTSLVTARVQDSTGADTPVANLDVFINVNGNAGSPLPVTWSSVGGTLSGQQATLQSSGGFAQATATYTATAAGAANSVTAKVDNDTTTGNTNTALITVNKADTAVVINTDNPDPSVIGTAITVNYTFSITNAPTSPTVPSGNISISDGVDTVGTCSAALGTNNCNITLTTFGNRTLTASYAGDANFNSSSDTEPHTVIAPDLTAIKTNNVSNATTLGNNWTWSIAVANGGNSGATFTTGQAIFTDNLPSTGLNYGAVTVTGVSGISGSGTISCAITTNNLSCVASGGTVIFANTASFNVNVPTTPTAVGVYANPRGGGICRVDPNTLVLEGNGSATGETNNDCSNSVTVTAPDLTAVKTNNVSGLRSPNSPWTWSIAVSNGGNSNAVFTVGQVVFRDNLPNANITYGAPTTAANATCAINGTFDLVCTANAGGLTVTTGGGFSISVPVTGASVAGSYANPRSGGSCGVDPDGDITESNEANNTCADTVKVFIPPTAVKAFTPASVPLNGDSLLSITITNPAANPAALTGVGFTDTFPAGLLTAAIANANNTCGGAFTVLNGSNSFALHNVVLNPGASCTAQLHVTPTTNGAKVNNVTITSIEGGNSANVTATLSVGKAPLDFDGDGTTDYAVVRDSGLPRGVKPPPEGPVDGPAPTGGVDGSGTPDGDGSMRGEGIGSLHRGYYFKLPGERFDPLAPRLERPDATQANQMRWLINTSGPTADLNILFGTLNDFPVPADYDGDGICDVAVWTGGVGAQFRVLTSSSGFTTTVTYTLGNAASDPSVVGDYDGDGKADPAVFNANTGQWSYLGGPTHSTLVTVTPVGTVGGVFPIPGDFDGDGKFDFMMETRDGINPTQGHFYEWLNNGTTTPPATTNFVFGNYRDVVVPGDYDGDGTTDVGLASVIVNPVAWRIRTSPAGTLLGPFNFGDPNNDYTVTGDYNGDQKGEITVWHAPGQFQSLLAPAYTTTQSFTWGQLGDYPVAYFNSH